MGIWRAAIQTANVDQWLHHKAIGAAGNVVHPSDRKNPVHVNVARHVARHLIDGFQALRFIQVVALEQTDQKLVVGKLLAQLPLQHSGGCLVWEVQAGCVVEVQTQQQGTTHDMDQHNDHQRHAPAQKPWLEDAQEERVPLQAA